jgi:alcohol dehydrogenase
LKIDPTLPLEEAALFGCAVMTGVGAVVNTAGVTAGSTVAVVGLGGVGLAAVLGAQAAGASRVVAIDLSNEKLAIAKELGATDCFNATSPDVVAEVREATRGGVGFAFEMAGSVKSMQTAYAITRRGGTTVAAGLPPPTHTLSIPQVQLVTEERTIRGSYVGTCVPARDIPNYIALYRAGRLPVNLLLSGRLRLEEINTGFDRLNEGKVIRQIVML